MTPITRDSWNSSRSGRYARAFLRRRVVHSRVRIVRLAVVLVSITGLYDPGIRAEVRLSLDGYYKNFSLFDYLPNFQRQILGVSDSPKGLVSNRLRLNARAASDQGLSLLIAYSILPRVQDPVFFSTGSGWLEQTLPVYRVDDLDFQLYPGSDESTSSFAVFQNLDRLLITYSAARFDLHVGRQPMAWGAARVINPTDIVAPFLYTELDTEDRNGVDAVRWRTPLGALSELDLGFIAGSDLKADKNAYYARSRFYALRSDVSLITMVFREHLMAGFDLARGIGGAGYWLEAAYVWMEAFAGPGSRSGPNYLRLSTGLDYSFPGNLYGYVEYHFNGAGSNDASDYFNLAFTTPYRDAAVYLLGKHYLAPGVSYPLTPLWLGSLNLIINVGDPSLLISPLIEYNIAEDIYLEAGAFVGRGEAADVTPAVPLGFLPIRFNSEFGAYDDLYYLSFRCYF